MLRSILAVLAGLAVMTIVVMVGVAIAAAVLIGSGAMSADVPVSPPPTGYLAANLIISLLAAVLGGYTTARIVGPRSLVQVIVLASIVLAMGLVTALSAGPDSGQPTWYGYVIPIIGAVGVLAGGHLGSLHAAVARAMSTSS